MAKTICADCGLQGVPMTVGILVVEMFQQPPVPYRMYRADEWACPGCGHRWIEGASTKATEPFDFSFREELAAALTTRANASLLPGGHVRCVWERKADSLPQEKAQAALEAWLERTEADRQSLAAGRD